MILLSSSLNSFFQLIGVLLIFILVLVITYFTTRWMGNYQKNTMRNKNLQVIETVRIANNKYISLMKAGKVYLVVAVGKDEVTLLAELTEEQLAEVPSFEDSNGNLESQFKISPESFQEIFQKVKNHIPKK